MEEKKKFYGRYEVINKLGEGAFSKVYKAKLSERVRKMSQDKGSIIIEETKTKTNENQNVQNIQAEKEQKPKEQTKSSNEVVALKKLNNLVVRNLLRVCFDFQKFKNLSILNSIVYYYLKFVLNKCRRV